MGAGYLAPGKFQCLVRSLDCFVLNTFDLKQRFFVRKKREASVRRIELTFRGEFRYRSNWRCGLIFSRQAAAPSVKANTQS
jgi:hypothetical protein